ncbi:MAG: permease [Thermodesulfobacterium sp.]|nr:permease [Thermodesulfobacterium sp.]
MYYLYIVTAFALAFSLIADRKKTLMAIKIAVKKFVNILPAFLTMLILVSIVLFLVPDKTISNCLGNNNKFVGMIFASVFGSITLMPGFIAFPLCGILLKKGVPYMVLSAFTTTLMMVGVLTYPIEKEYFGMKVTVIRNVISFFIAIIVALVIGIFFGEVF